MKKVSIVQAIILTLAGIAIVAAVFLFAFGNRGDRQSQMSPVEIWGTLPKEIFNNLFSVESAAETGEEYSHITYVEKSSENFEEEFVSALAEGRGPDLVFLRENQMIENKDRLVQIPYSSYDARNYREAFIEEANLLALDEGYVGFPIYIDPLVLYYNRDTLNSNGIARPPQTWTELLSITPRLNDVDSSFNVSKTSVGLGTYDNVANSKEIIWSLIMQAGNDVVIPVDSPDGEIDEFQVLLKDKLNFSVQPAQAALNFYTQFSNPGKTIYSWNKSMPSTQDFFVAGNAAFYLGFASELPILKIKNPNLNFDVAEIPQSKNSSKKTTYGKMHFLAITKDAGDVNSAFATLIQLSDKPTQEKLSQITGLPSVRRDLLSSGESSNSFDPIFRRSALFAQGIIEPDSTVTGQILENMIQVITSGEFEIGEAISRADEQLRLELEQ
jgi:ABC-type glycerol-3-phosphate transport system substrate-binding protein